MPSPYGRSRSASTYYEHAGAPDHYIIDWVGLPPIGARAAETRSLGDYLDIQARYHKVLAGYSDHPVAMTMATGRRSVLHSGPEQTQLDDGTRLSDLGLIGSLSRSERRFGAIAAAALAGWLAWKKWG